MSRLRPTSPPAFLRSCAPIAVALTLALSGCGGGSDSSTTTGGGGGDNSDEGRVKLTQCLRDNGVDVPDNPAAGGAAGAQNIDREKLQEAINGPCKEYQTGAFGNASGEDRQEMQDAFQKFAQCMRDEGVDVPDLNLGSGGVPPAGGDNAIDQDDPKVQAAMKACQDEMPQGIGPGGQ